MPGECWLSSIQVGAVPRLQAAVVSACCFASGASLPLLSSIFISDPNTRLGVLCAATTVGL